MEDMSHSLVVRKVTNDDDKSNDNSGDSIKVILRLLEIGLIFEYLQTIGIINILTSSHQLLCFEGIPRDIYDRVLWESFKKNKSLRHFKLIKLPSSTLTCSSMSSTSLITIAPGLSEFKAREILIAKVPETPFVLHDLKIAYELMQKVKCCFNVNSSCLNRMNHVRTIRNDENSERKGIKIVSISNTEPADRKILINHFASRTNDGMYAVYSQKCNECKIRHCIRCFTTKKCKGECQKSYCSGCARRCHVCEEWLCDECGIFDECSNCDGIFCWHCGTDGTCDSCYDEDDDLYY